MDVRDRVIALPEVRLHVREWPGPDEAGVSVPAVILVHGLASNAHIWDAVAPVLARSFRVVAVDQRGHGESDKPDHGYDFPTVVADLDALVGALGARRLVLVGHSWGGNVVLEFAATHPDAVSALVLVDGGFIELAAEPAMTWERVVRELAPPDLTALRWDQLVARVRSGAAGAYWSAAVVATLEGSFGVAADGHVFPRLSLANHLAILRALWEQRPSELYPRICCPVLIVPARPVALEADAAVGPREERVARAAAAIQDARVLWMEDTVHDIPLHRPEALAAAIGQCVGWAGAL